MLSRTSEKCLDFMTKISTAGLDVGTYFSKLKDNRLFNSAKKESTNSQDSSTNRGVTCLSRIRTRLFTAEDRTNAHKILGLLSVWSFMYRYYLVWSDEHTLGFDNSVFDWTTMFLHLTLSSSSLIFHVLRRRNPKHNMMIWQEYRLHAIVFTLRCFLVFVFAMVRPLESFGTIAEVIGLYCAVMFNHVLADIITKKFGTPGDTAVRVRHDDTRPWYLTLGARYYSFYQFMALGSHLVVTERLGDMGFNTLIAIQSSAFLMTLYRKQLIRWYSHAFWYTACLWLSTFHILYAMPSAPAFLAKVLGAFLLRTQLRWNKYVIWALFAAVSMVTPEQIAAAFATVQESVESWTEL